MDYSKQIKHWNDIYVGDVETFTKTMTQTDMVLWVGLKPVYVGDTITAVATVIEKMDEKHRVKIKTECFNQRDELVIVGEGQEYIM